MEHGSSTGNIILNVAVQVINIALFFWVVVRFFAKPLSKDIEARMEKEKKLAAAEETYKSMISDAEKQAESILKDASSHKDNLIRQGELAGKQRTTELVEDAERKAKNILDTAEKQASLVYSDLEKHFVDAVQSTSRKVVKKIFAEQQVEEAYMNNLIAEFTKTATEKGA